jgi:mRNA degradation ribonuclease J1/J2
VADGRSRHDLRRSGYPGIELVLPISTFIEKNRKDLLGVVLTHGHEDHIGAIPYLAADLGVPLWATPFTAGLIANKLEEEGLSREVKLNVVESAARCRSARSASATCRSPTRSPKRTLC